MKPLLLCPLLAIVLFTTIAEAQTVSEVQSTVNRHLHQLEKWYTIQHVSEADDSMDAINHRLLTYMISACTNNTALLSADLDFTNSSMEVLTSEDHKFRIYFWDGGGSRKPTYYSVLIQYKTTNGTAVKVINDVSIPDEFSVTSGSVYLAIHTIKTKTNKAVYLVIAGMKLAMGFYGQSIQAFSIENDRLNDSLKFFKTTKGAVNGMSCYFDNEVAKNADKMYTSVTSIKLSADKQKLYIPLINVDDEITGKYLVYTFDGNNYVFDKNLK